MDVRRYKKRKVGGITGKLEGRVELLVSGFGVQKIIPVDDIVKAVNLLPDAHVAGLRAVEYDPDRHTAVPGLFSRIFRRPPPCLRGIFLQRKRKIIIYDFDSRDQFFHILYHEIGHFVFYLVLDSDAKKRWVKQLHRNRPFITRLAARNAGEDFAECYATYLLKPEKLKFLKDKYDFIHEVVFANHPLAFEGSLVDIIL